jgi:hypothetical protein
MTNEEIKQAIAHYQLEYITTIAIDSMDYDKLSLIIALATGRVATSQNILELVCL